MIHIYKSLLFFFILLLVLSYSNSGFRYSFVSLTKSLLTSRLSSLGLSTLFCFAYYHNSILARFISSKNRRHSSSSRDLYCLNSNRTTTSLAEVLKFPLMSSQALFMSSLTFKLSRAANGFQISI